MADQATATLLVDIKQALARFSELERAFRDTTVKMQASGESLAVGAEHAGEEYADAYEKMEKAAGEAEAKLKDLAQLIQTMGHRADIKLLNLGESVKDLDRYKEQFAETMRSLRAARAKQVAEETAAALELEQQAADSAAKEKALEIEIDRIKEQHSSREFKRVENTAHAHERAQKKLLEANAAVERARSKGATDESARLQALARKAAQVYLDAGAAQKRYEDAKSKYAGEDRAALQALQKEYKDLYDTAEKEAREYKAAVDAIGKGSNQNIQRLEREAKKAYDAMTTGAVRVAKGLHGLGAAVDDVAARERRAAERREKDKHRAIDGYAEMARSLQRLYNVVALGFLGRFAVESIKANIALERLQVTLRAINRDAEGSAASIQAGADAYAFVRAEVERLKIPLIESVEGFTKLTAASKGTALEGQGVRDVFSSVSEVTRTLQLNSEQTRLAFYALQQMMSKGKVTTEELRRQFAEQIPGAFEAAARAMNVSTQELDSMLRKGEIVSSEFLPKFAAELKKTFGPGLEDALNSRTAQIQAFNNALLESKAAFAEGFVSEVVEGAKEAAGAMKGLQEEAEFAGKEVGFLVGHFSDLASIGASVAKFWGSFLGGNDALQLRTASLEAFVAQLRYMDRYGSAIEFVTGGFVDFGRVIEEVEGQISGLQGSMDAGTKGALSRFTEALEDLKNKTPGSIGAATVAFAELFAEMQANGHLTEETIDGLAKRGEELARNYEVVPPILQTVMRTLRDLGAQGDPVTAKILAIQTKINELREAEDELGEEIAAVGKEMERQTFALVNYYNHALEKGELNAEQQLALKKKSQELLDQWRTLGREVPAEFQAIADAIGAVSTAEQEAIKEAERLEKAQKKAAEEAAREHERAAAQIAAAYDKMSDSVADIFSRLQKQLKPGDGAEDQKKELADLQAEYDELRNAPTSSTEEFNRINELDVLIQQKQKDVATAINESVGKVREGVSESFKEMILGNSNLIEGLALLPQASQNAFVGLVENFNNAAEAGTITEGRLKNFGNTVATIFEQAGINVQGLREQLSGTATIADELIAKIRDAAMLRDQTGKPTGSGGASTEDAKETAQAAGQIVRSQQAIGTAVAGSAAELAQQRQMVVDLADITDKSSVGVDYFTEATEKQSVSLAQLAEETKKARDYTREYNNELVEVDSATTSAAVAAVQAARATTEREISTENLNDALAGFAARQDEVNSSVIGSIQGSNQATEALQEQTEATTTTTEATAEAVEGSIEWSLAQKKVKEETDKSAKSLEDLGKNMEGIFGEKTLEGMDKVIQKMRDELLPVCRELRDCLNEIS
jgi:tape measure domain-containing protein